MTIHRTGPTRGQSDRITQIEPPAGDVRRNGAATSYRARRTLSLWTETRRQLSRRRTQIALGFLVVLPFLLVAAFKFGNGGRGGGANSPALVSLATHSAANFTVFTLYVSTGFLLVVVVALFAGDTIASEASWSSLRYLLAMPVPRSHLLVRKFVVALGYSLVAIVLLPVVAFVAGGLWFGWGSLRTPLGDSISGSQVLVRLVIAVAFIALSLVFVAALAFLVGTWTDAPLGAVGGAVMLVILSNILDAVTALGSARRFLPTHYAFAWTDVLTANITWDEMGRGVLYSLGYSIVLLAAAWWHFERKDITS